MRFAETGASIDVVIRFDFTGRPRERYWLLIEFERPAVAGKSLPDPERP